MKEPKPEERHPVLCGCECAECDLGQHCYDARAGCYVNNKTAAKELLPLVRSGHAEVARAA